MSGYQQPGSAYGEERHVHYASAVEDENTAEQDMFDEYYPDPSKSMVENLADEWSFSRHEQILYQKGVWIQGVLLLIFATLIFTLRLAAPMKYWMAFIFMCCYCGFLIGLIFLVVIYHSFLKPTCEFDDPKKELEAEKEYITQNASCLETSAYENGPVVSAVSVPVFEESMAELLEGTESILEVSPSGPSTIQDSALVGGGNFVSFCLLILTFVILLGDLGLRLATYSCTMFFWNHGSMDEMVPYPGYCSAVNVGSWVIDPWVPFLFFFSFNYTFAKLDKLFFFILALGKLLVLVLVYTSSSYMTTFYTMEGVNYFCSFIILFYLFLRKLSFHDSPVRRQLSLALYSIYIRYAFQLFIFTYIYIVWAVQSRNFDMHSTGRSDVKTSGGLYNEWLGGIMVWVWSAFPSSLYLLSVIRMKKKKLDFWKKVCSISNAVVVGSMYAGFAATNAYNQAAGHSPDDHYVYNGAKWVGRLTYYTLPPLIFYQFYIGFRSVRTKLTTNNLNDLGLVPNLVPGHTFVLPVLLTFFGLLHGIAWFVASSIKGKYPYVALFTGIGMIVLFIFIVLSYKFMHRLSASIFLYLHWGFLLPSLCLLFFHVKLKTGTGKYLWTTVFLILVFCVIEKFFFTNFFKATLAKSQMIRSYLVFTLKLRDYSRFANSYKPGQTTMIYFERTYRSDGNPSRKFFKESFKRTFSVADVRRMGTDVYLEYHITPVLSGTELLVQDTSYFSFQVTRGFWGGFGRFLHRRGPAVLYGNGVGAAPLVGLLRTEYYGYKAKEEEKKLCPFLCVISDRDPYLNFLTDSLALDKNLGCLITADFDEEAQKTDRVILLLNTGRGTNWTEIIRKVQEKWVYSRGVCQILGCGSCTASFTPSTIEEVCVEAKVRHFYKPHKPSTEGKKVLYRAYVDDPAQLGEWMDLCREDKQSAFVFLTNRENRKAIEAEAKELCDVVFSERSGSRDVWNALTDNWQDAYLDLGGDKSAKGKEEDGILVSGAIAKRRVAWVLDASEDVRKHVFWLKHVWGKKNFCIVSGHGIALPKPNIGVLTYSKRLWPKAMVLTEQ